jgi:hypothetical protein
MRPAPCASRIVTLGLALQVVTAGCSYGAAIVTDDGRLFPPTPPQSVELYPGGNPGFPFILIGPVAAFTFGEAPDAMRELAVQAAALGADAVIEVRLSKLSKNTGASGVAVKRAPPPVVTPPAVTPPPAAPRPPASPRPSGEEE